MPSTRLRIFRCLALSMLGAVLSVSCASTRSRYVQIQDGDTIVSIAQRTGIPVSEIRRYNRSGSFAPGEKLYMPYEHAGREGNALSADGAKRKPAVMGGGRDEETIVVGPLRKKDFVRYGLGWPLREGKVTSVYGARGCRFHEGIDVSAPRGSQIRAAQKGRVIYASQRIAGYGRMIIIDHGNQIKTVYAHLQRMNVREGAVLKKGQLIGSVGTSGNATGPHLHFEVRNGAKSHDPLYYLPERPAMAIAANMRKRNVRPRR